MNTEDTLSGFQEFVLQSIIKDRSNVVVSEPEAYGISPFRLMPI